MTEYYYTDGKERYGPFTVEQLRERNIAPDTLVWKEGMADWLPARQVSELEGVFGTGATFSTPTTPVSAPPALPPKNWLVESILVTILCCLPFGIVGIIHATKVESLWNTGQRDAAVKASQDAGKWVKIGFFTGLAVWSLYFLLMIFGVIAGIGFGSSIPEY